MGDKEKAVVYVTIWVSLCVVYKKNGSLWLGGIKNKKGITVKHTAAAMY